MIEIEKIFLKTIGGFSCIAESIGLYAFLRALNRKNVIILMNHGVTARQDNVANFDGKHITLAKFEEQLQYLLKNYSLISLDDFLAWKAEKRKLPKNPVLLTFDDGYANCYTHLFPLLKKYKIPATIFLPTQYINRKEPAWYDAITYCIAKTKEREITINEKKYLMTTEKQKIAVLVALKEKILNASERKERLVEEVAEQTKIDPKYCRDDNFLFCSWEQCLKMCQNEETEITFGSHSVTHQLLTQLSAMEVKKEAEESKKIIEAKLKQECNAFAYPFGPSNDLVRKEIAKAGYKCGFSTTYGRNTKNTSPYEIKRIALNNFYDLPIFALTLFINLPVFHHWLLEKYSNLGRVLSFFVF